MAVEESTAPATVVLTYTLQRADLAHAGRVVRRLARFGWLFGPKGLVLLGAFWSLLVVGSVLSREFSMGIWLAPACVLIAAAMPEIQAAVTMRASQGTLGEQQVVLDGQGVRVTLAHADTLMRWQQFQGYREGARYFDLPLVDTVGRQLLVLPKRALDSAETDGLRSLLATRLTALDR